MAIELPEPRINTLKDIIAKNLNLYILGSTGNYDVYAKSPDSNIHSELFRRILKDDTLAFNDDELVSKFSKDPNGVMDKFELFYINWIPKNKVGCKYNLVKVLLKIYTIFNICYICIF